MELSTEILVNNFSKYKKRLVKYVGEGQTESIIKALGGEEAVMNATFANISNTGLAYKGSLCHTLIVLTTYAIKLNELLPDDKRVNNDEIVKVALLSHIGKVLLYKESNDEWRKKNLGEMFTYNNNLEGALRVGERSFLIAENAGVKFTELEYEAMLIMDKQNDKSDNYTKYYSSTLSLIIKQANEIVTMINKK